MKTALITGVTGQDGAYLARHLLSLGYRVIGASRDAENASTWRLSSLGVLDQVELRSVSLSDFRSVLQALSETNPDEIYNLAGQSSVGLSFSQPVETLESVSIGVLNLIEALRYLKSDAKLYNAGSSECFGDAENHPATETTPFHPRSPYATAKAAAFWQTANYREAYGLFACSGILFNHESPLRAPRFVTRKITSTVKRIKQGSGETLQLGNIKIQRDWGWAPEYVEAMHLILQQDAPEDYVIATGATHSLEDFVAEAFGAVGLDWAQHVEFDDSLIRPSELMISRADPSKAAEKLGWRATKTMPDVAKAMMASEMDSE